MHTLFEKSIQKPPEDFRVSTWIVLLKRPRAFFRIIVLIVELLVVLEL